MSVAEFIVVAPGEGKTVTVLGDTYTSKARGEDTAGHYGLVGLVAPAGSPGPPPHVHEGEEEALYVVDGELCVQIGQRTMEAVTGAFVLVPRGTIHTFSNPSSKPAKVLFSFRRPASRARSRRWPRRRRGRTSRRTWTSPLDREEVQLRSSVGRRR